MAKEGLSGAMRFTMGLAFVFSFCLQAYSLGWCQVKDVKLLLEQLRKGESPEERFKAAESLAEIKDSSIVKGLIDAALKEKHDGIRIRILTALAAGGHQEAFDCFIQVLSKDPNPTARGIAAVGLGALGDKQAVSALISALGDNEWSVRSSAAIGLGALKGERVVAGLAAALNDVHPNVQEHAIRALAGTRDTKAVRPLIAYLKKISQDPAHKTFEKHEERQRLELLAFIALIQITGENYGNVQKWEEWATKNNIR